MANDKTTRKPDFFGEEPPAAGDTGPTMPTIGPNRCLPSDTTDEGTWWTTAAGVTIAFGLLTFASHFFALFAPVYVLVLIFVTIVAAMITVIGFTQRAVDVICSWLDVPCDKRPKPMSIALAVLSVFLALAMFLLALWLRRKR